MCGALCDLLASPPPPSRGATPPPSYTGANPSPLSQPMAPSFRTCHDRSGPLALCLVAACSVFYALEALRAAPAPSALHTSVRLPPPQTAPRPFAGGTRTAPGNQPSPRSLPTPGGPRPLRSSQPSPVPVPAPVRPQKRQPEAVGVPRALREWGLLCVAAAVGLWLPLRLGLGLGMALSAVAMATGLGGTVGLATGLGLGLGAGLVGCLAPGHTDADGAGARGCEYVAMLSTSGSPAPDPDVPPKVIGRRQWLAGGLGAAAAAGAAGAAARALAAAPVAEVQAGAQPEEQALVADVPLPAVARVQKALARFALGGVAGGIGATAVYPVDFVKTRMQAQEEPQTPAQVAAAVTPAAAPVPDDAEDPPVVCYLYESGWDCAMRTAREAGPGALYRGLGAQLLGVAPEKAIKLTVNDVLRQALWAPGAVPLWGAMLCGAAAGTAQVCVLCAPVVQSTSAAGPG